MGLRGGLLGVLLLSAGCTAVVAGVERLAPGWGDPARWLLLFGAMLAPCLLWALVLGRSLDVWAARLGAYLECLATAGAAQQFRPPASLRALTQIAERCAKDWLGRSEAMSHKLREAEIRLSITEAERRHAEEILHSLKDAVLVTDAFNELSLANESAARLLGFDKDGSIHKPIESVITDETLRRLIKEVRHSGVASRQKRIEHTIGTGDGPDGRRSHGAFDVTMACLPDGRRGVGGVVTILRDITKEKEISQMKSDFVSQASHELRTPLASINAYIEMLLDGEAKDEGARQEFYQIIKSESDRVTRMIDNMLNISRIEAGIVSAERGEVDFAKLVKEVCEMMQPQAKAKGIMLIEKAGPLIYTAEADRDMIYQVIMNLVSNAIKYTPDNGRVTVAVENDDATRSVLVSVADTGLGIPPDAIGKLFEKFYRVENYKRIAKGTGLGLNLVKHIVETVHRGKVGVTSQVGMGSRFWFTIPYEFQGG